MIAFNLSDPESYEQPENEPWPTMYSMLLLNVGYLMYPYGECGSMLTTMDGACCISAIDPSDNPATGTFGVTSATDFFFEDDSLDNLSHNMQQASNKDYCLLSSLYEDEWTLEGYLHMLYLGDGGCFDSTRCIHHQIIFYNDTHCQTEIESFDLDTNQQTITTLFYGDINAQLYTVENATMQVTWTNYQPDYILVPNFKEFTEIIAVVLYILTLLIMSFSLYSHALSAYRGYTHMKMVAAVSRFFWIAWTVGNMCYTYIIYSDLNTLFITDSLRGISLAIASLTMVLYSNFFIYTATGMPQLWRIICTVLTLVLHIGLVGGQYGYFALIVNPELGLEFLFKWGRNSKYWIMFMYVWDIVPAAVAVALVVRKKKLSMRASVAFIMERDRFMFAAFGLQALLIVGYYMVQYVRQQTIWLQNDRVNLSADAWVTFIEANHSIMNVVIIDRVRVFMGIKRSRVTSQKKLQEKSSVFKSEALSMRKKISLKAPQSISADSQSIQSRQSATKPLYKGRLSEIKEQETRPM
ncbi:hypothetical protein EDD86DRAFT_212684 [Gorgonomyces haynaldii]|nr:hypothetical protein EDD86DRAFT_212684 [Gorgonomyces haynaldii]